MSFFTHKVPVSYRGILIKARHFFLSKLSTTYFADAHSSEEESIMGYESSWPSHYKKLR